MFGKDGKGSIGISARYHQIVLQQIINEKGIGERLENSDVKELPKIELNFFDPKSIDTLITCLQAVKDNWQPPPPSFAEAC